MLNKNIALIFVLSSVFGGYANAQSMGAFALEEPPQIVPQPHPYAVETQAKLDVEAQMSKGNEYIIPKDIKPNQEIQKTNNKGPLRIRYYKVPQDLVVVNKPEAQSNINPSYAEVKNNHSNSRGHFKAIYEDTKTAIIEDVPQKIVDVLPWVDKDRKQQDSDEVLAKVSDALARANQSDPEWIKPAKDELYSLSRAIDGMANPPQLKSEYQAPQLQSQEIHPFKSRPVWPGAKIVQEASYRPIALKTISGAETGNAEILLLQKENSIKSIPHKSEEKIAVASKKKSPIKKNSAKKNAKKCYCK